MAVNVKSQDTAPVPQTTAPEVRIALTGCGRLVFGGRLYEADVVYTATPEQAKELLAFEIEPKLYAFSPYVERGAEAAKPTGPEVRPAVPPPAPAGNEAQIVSTEAGTKALEIGSKDEEKELFGDVDKDDTAEV